MSLELKKDIKYRAFYFSLDVIHFLESLSFRQSIKIISDQLIRSVTSIGANIVEARGSSSKKEFLKFIQISLKSSFEVTYWLALLDELLLDRKEEMAKLKSEANEINKILNSSVLTLKGCKKL
ncbi:four helix bundle protein [candidate division WWE3 bacterium CG08_land_8_20_14_0_20_40_13]|uniref:Four helix bundle protein n=1 Tax=candidate division WWE3 bacterium CG08_land_8_20_14_0_20_40_13 TaxID=1975084 RepID=A0A2H0XEU3_UNCKA|nr:MAG: four helix bundle protein [candidate division WWE3 bacterium CG08_land_8_20_14_0_20_40_13]